ncbi:MAG TPA: DUF5709 domain-containing protein [Mycobacteriales bacterium]|jgi:Family of unknown function (DUF5709)|nr:DUF5709 domain-containing protein [Mycobacteriales bacterium]
MSVDPGGLESGSDPQDPVIDFDEESTLDDNEVLDPIDEGDGDNDPDASIYDTSWVPDDRPSHRTDYGDTLTEMREGEPLDRRLAEDEPDLLEQELGDPVDQILGQRRDAEDDPDFEEDTDARLATEADDDPEVRASLAEAGGDTDVPAPEFEEQQPRAGRLVEPDEGLESDTEKDMIAYDAGISGAGASAEEAAVHLTDEP